MRHSLQASIARRLVDALTVGLVVGLIPPSELAGSQARPLATPTAAPSATPIAFTGVTIVDVVSGRLLAEQTVVTSGRRIEAVGPAGETKVPKGARAVDARGKYLVPGLWDMHVHTRAYPQIFYPLLIANGVTGIREMNTPHFDSLLAWRREIVAGRRTGPRIVAAAGYLGMDPEDGFRLYDGPGPEIAVTTPAQARAVVDSLRAAGADVIKVRGGLSRDVYFAIAAEARRRGIALVGHLSDSVSAVEASDSGQRSIEHSFESDCSAPDRDDECAALAARFARNGTWVTPTIVVGRYILGGAAPERLRYWPDTVGGQASIFQGGGLGDRWKPVIARYKRAGMPLLAGTDAAPAFPENTPGFSLHEELALLVEGGLTPLEALQAATLNPAKYFGAADSLGTVAAGKVADLVLLDANPLADIQNTTEIRAVVADGRYFDRAALDGLIAEVERQGRGGPAHQAP